MVCQVYNHYEITYLPLYTPTEEESQNAFQYSETVRCQIGKVLQIPLSSLAVEDVLLWSWAQLQHVKRGTSSSSSSLININVTIAEMRQQFGSADVGQLKQLFQAFHRMDRDASGLLSREEFVQGIVQDYQQHQLLTEDDDSTTDQTQSMPSSLELRRYADQLFNAFDRNHSGRLDLREFIWGLYTLTVSSSNSSNKTNPQQLKQAAELAFTIYGVDGDVSVSLEAVHRILSLSRPQVTTEMIDQIVNRLEQYDDVTKRPRSGQSLQRRFSLRTFTSLAEEFPEMIDVLPETLRLLVNDKERND